MSMIKCQFYFLLPAPSVEEEKSTVAAVPSDGNRQSVKRPDPEVVDLTKKVEVSQESLWCVCWITKKGFRQIWRITVTASFPASIISSKYTRTMPMQIVFPISMIAVGVAGAGGLVVVCNKMLYGKVGFCDGDDDTVELPPCDDRWI